jgi:SAM-dependent methyltransferase
MIDWFENQDFWRDCQHIMFSEERIAGSGAEVDGIIAATNIQPPERVLDLCCGIGRHSAEFANRGFGVTGVDLSTHYLEQAKRRCPEIELVHADMREFRREGAFALAVNLYTSLGYFEDPADDARVLGNLAACLRPGGQAVIEIKGKENLARVFEPIKTIELPDGTVLITRHELEGDWERCRATWTCIKDGETTTHSFVTRLYSAVEFRALLTSCGFESVRFLGSLDGEPLNHLSNRLVAIAKMPA